MPGWKPAASLVSGLGSWGKTCSHPSVRGAGDPVLTQGSPRHCTSLGWGHSLSVTFTLCPLGGQAGGRGGMMRKKGTGAAASAGGLALE